MHCSSSLWLPGNRKPIEVDSDLSECVTHCDGADTSSTRREKSAVCTTLSTSCRIGPFLEPSHTTCRIGEAPELRNWFFHLREHVIAVGFQLCPTGPVPAAILACGSGFETMFGTEVSASVAGSPSGLPLNPVGIEIQGVLIPCLQIDWGPALQRQGGWQLPFSNLEPPRRWDPCWFHLVGKHLSIAGEVCDGLLTHPLPSHHILVRGKRHFSCSSYLSKVPGDRGN